jgi:selenium-binding protein 1
MLEVSRDGTRIYFSNSLYGAGTPSSTQKVFGAGLQRSTRCRAAGSNSILTFLYRSTARPLQIRLQGGDCSSDSFCFP